VEEPGIAPPEAAMPPAVYVQMLTWFKRACAALASIESGVVFRPDRISTSELSRIYSNITSDSRSDEEKRQILFDLGKTLCAESWIQRPLVAIPVPRFDLFEGKGPASLPSMRVDREIVRTARQAASDLISGFERTAFGTRKKRQAYDGVTKTLIKEERLISCQTALISGVLVSEPIQLSAMPTALFNVIRDFNAALAADSRKCAELFRAIEQLLGEVLPEGLRTALAGGHDPVTFLSDLPFEWAMVDEWPVCLTRSVSRVPLTLNHWDTLVATASRHVVLDDRWPERVLVFDLVAPGDPARHHSDSFAHSSESLKQHYRYESPTSGVALNELLRLHSPEIVVLDAHGIYDEKRDQLSVNMLGTRVPVEQFVADELVPPLWILSSCSTSVSGARRGCLVRHLLSRGGYWRRLKWR
jgi:hypothetical protein